MNRQQRKTLNRRRQRRRHQRTDQRPATAEGKGGLITTDRRVRTSGTNSHEANSRFSGENSPLDRGGTPGGPGRKGG